MYSGGKYCVFVLVLLCCLGCEPEDSSVRFSLIPPALSRVAFNNELKPDSSLNILSYLYFYNGAGVSAADYNNDGLVDLYFTSNQSADKLYLNMGNLQFQDVTVKAGIANDHGWTFGVTHVDINSDGLMDMYLTKVGKYKSITGNNLLYVNNGVDSQGIPSFTEKAEEFGLDVAAFSTHAAFFDYDLDSDLDLFLLNHSVHPNRSYGKGGLRDRYDSLAGDRFFENVGGVFRDISKEVGIHQGRTGYGLDLSVGDLNSDGFPDVYVGNDFFENDYLYINDGKGRFIDQVLSNPESVGHTTHFSMGNAISDLNNDQSMDIVSLDMLPSDLLTYKSSGVEFPFSIYQSYLKNGYNPQYMSNTLHQNNANGTFSEVGFLSGIAATEWSWNVLAADFDLDGKKDLHITNGITRATNDMDFISFIAEDEIQREIVSAGFDKNLSFIEKMPQKKVDNFTFRNKGDLRFEDVSSEWFVSKPSFSSGSTYADLDNDGDLDLIINNVGEAASIFENKSADGNHFIKVNFEGPFGNVDGIGAMVAVYVNGTIITEQNYPHNSYLSSTPVDLNIGIGEIELIDSLVVIWPGGKREVVLEPQIDSKIELNYEDAKETFKYVKRPTASISAFDFQHEETSSLEFEREALIPLAKGYQGPEIEVNDINRDGLSDVFIGGAKNQSGVFFVQNGAGGFTKLENELLEQYRLSEETGAVFFDLNGDHVDELLIVSGGNEFRNGKALQPRIYGGIDRELELLDQVLPSLEVNASVVKSLDFDNDGDQDVVIGSNSIPGEYGKIPNSFLLENVNGQLVDVTAERGSDLKNIGQVEDLNARDVNGDGFVDLIVVGHWMEVTILLNEDGSFSSKEPLPNSRGLWNVVLTHDFDSDGDQDIVAGNWGLNSRLTASSEQPMSLYVHDFDNNGKSDPLVTYYYKEVETPLASKDELTKQIPQLNKKFLSYQAFAEASVEELFTSSALQLAEKKEVTELSSCYFENQGDGTYTKIALPRLAQISTINAMASFDFNEDGLDDLFVAGNTHAINTQLGRMDASHGLILLRDLEHGFVVAKEQPYVINGAVRDIELIEVKGQPHLIVGINNGEPQLIPIR